MAPVASATLSGAALSESDDSRVAWVRLAESMPPRHHILVSGPWADGHVTVLVIDQTSGRVRSVVKVKGQSLTEALTLAYHQFQVELEQQEATAVTTVQSRGKSGRVEKKLHVSPAKINQLAEVIGKGLDGFTRDRDLVAHLVWKNGRVTQYELRHQYGIKNPAQAVNDAEKHYKFKMETGGALANGDVPYRLIGDAPQVEGMLPMFGSVEDPDEKLYVLELDLYSCVDCGRHPVYRPTKWADTKEDGYSGVCPRHGPTTFTRA